VHTPDDARTCQLDIPEGAPLRAEHICTAAMTLGLAFSLEI